MDNLQLQMPTQLSLMDSDVTDKLPALTKYGMRQDRAVIVRQAFSAHLKEQGRVALTNTALENVGALSSLEDHLTQIVPNAAYRLRHIVDAYTIGAVKAISRW